MFGSRSGICIGDDVQDEDDNMKRKIIHEPLPLLAEGISRLPGS